LNKYKTGTFSNEIEKIQTELKYRLQYFAEQKCLLLFLILCSLKLNTCGRIKQIDYKQEENQALAWFSSCSCEEIIIKYCNKNVF